MRQKANRWTTGVLARVSLLTVLMILGPTGISSVPQSTCGLLARCALAQPVPVTQRGAPPAPADTSLSDTFTALDSPLLRLHPLPFTAHQLRGGEVLIDFRSRLYYSRGPVEEEGINLFYDTGFTWGITDALELTLQFQHVDSTFPGRQGPFEAVLTDDNEGTAALRYLIWHNAARTLHLGSSVSLSIGDRGVLFRRPGQFVEDDNQAVVPAFQLPVTAVLGGLGHLTLAPTVAIFPDDHALFLFRPPLADADTFGLLFGFSGAASYRLHPRLVLWGDLFVPVTGNNSINRDSGQPDHSVTFNAGVRYLVNPRLALDVFASNALGSVGPLALLADQDEVGLGTSVAFLSDIFAANRRYPDRFVNPEAPIPFVPTSDGIAFFDGGTLPSRYLLMNLQGGMQGVLASLHFVPLEDLELALYLDYIFSDVDESEQGVGAKLRLLNQAETNLFTASVAVTVGLTNRVFLNFFRNDRDAFDNSGLDRNVPFLPNGDDGPEGEVFLMTFSLPLHYQFDSGVAFWVTPILGVVQRRGVEIAGVNVGGAVPLFRNILSVLAEVGGNVAGEGNAFLNDHLEDAIPWAAAVRLHFDRLQRRRFRPTPFPGPRLEVYVTNRVGSSPFQSLRVRADSEVAVGGGLSIPFKLF